MPSDSAQIHHSPAAKISRLLRIALVLFLTVYFLDVVWFYARRTYPELGTSSGSIHRRRLLAISNKGNKTEYTIDAVRPEEDLPCAHSLFSHDAQKPCWYLARHANDPIAM